MAIENNMNRRQSFKILTAAIAASASATGLLGRSTVASAQTAPQPFSLPPLGYGHAALEPHIDTATVELHHTKHHQAFVDLLNRQVEKYPELASKPLEAILSDLATVPEAVRTPIRNGGGGHWNHTHYWNVMTPGGAKDPSGDLQSALNGAFGDTAKMVQAFNTAAQDRFGSGWAWLTVDKNKKLIVTSTPNQDSPHTIGARGAVLGIDVWEHAYYLKYQNRRAEYVKSWWNTVNWDKASANFRQLVS